MRIVLFLIWVALGFCLFVSGCRMALSAGELEVALSIGAPGIVAPEIQEVDIDKDRIKPE